MVQQNARPSFRRVWPNCHREIATHDVPFREKIRRRARNDCARADALRRRTEHGNSVAKARSCRYHFADTFSHDYPITRFKMAKSQKFFAPWICTDSYVEVRRDTRNDDGPVRARENEGYGAMARNRGRPVRGRGRRSLECSRPVRSRGRIGFSSRLAPTWPIASNNPADTKTST